MGERLEDLVATLLRVPPAPGAPPGEEGTTCVFRASRRYYLYRLVGWGLTRALAVFGLLAALGSGGALLRATGEGDGLVLGLAVAGLGLFVVQSLLSYFALRLDYAKRWYLVTDRSLRIREGVVLVREMTVSFANIQNISVSQGPIQRLLGISDVRVDTAGGAGSGARQEQGMSLHTAFFRGVDNADRIRALMQDRLRQLKDAGLGDGHDRVDGQVPIRPGSRAAGPGLDLEQAPVRAVLREIHAEARALRTLLGS